MKLWTCEGNEVWHAYSDNDSPMYIYCAGKYCTDESVPFQDCVTICHSQALDGDGLEKVS